MLNRTNILTSFWIPFAGIILFCSFYTSVPGEDNYFGNKEISEVTSFRAPGSVVSDDYTRTLYVSKIVPETFSERDTEKETANFIRFSDQLKRSVGTWYIFEHENFSNSYIRKLLFPFHYFW